MKQICLSAIIAATALGNAHVIAEQLTLVPGQLAQAPAASTAAPERPVVDDREIALRVQSALAKDKEVAALNLSIKVTAGVVELSGIAPDRMKVNRAVEIARSVPGVKAVKNDVTVS
jgi:osmotically-inducible protein OsmY